MTADDLDALGARVATAGSTGASTSRQILDSGRHGLEFFRRFGPAYAALTGGEFDFERDFARRYDGGGEFGFAVLRADQERFAAIAEGLADVAINLRNRGAAVFGVWEGGSAAAARSQFSGLLSAAGELRGQFDHLAEVLAEVVEVADRACFAKAEGVSRLRANEIDGRDHEEVAFLVGVAPRLRFGEPDDGELAEAARLCPVAVTPEMRRTPAGQARLSLAVDAWLTGTFVPEYESRAGRFDRLCATADQELGHVWDILAAALNEVRADQSDAVLADEPAPARPSPALAIPPTPAASVARPESAPASPNERPSATGAGPVVADFADDPAGPDIRAEPLAADHAPDDMTPQGFRGPAAAVPAPPAAGPASTSAGGTYFGGIPFFGGNSAQGGGDREYRPLNLPTTHGAFDDLRAPAGESPSAIGADDDRRYDDDAAVPDSEPENPAQKASEQLLDDVWDNP
jgi:hypothetical protein